ncbi:BatD family protein, partial [Fusobacterium sp.]|uniref:BatD family protein n=1 Tax=Fusobacterium sp. TaxID=68766 RepID=UPI0026185F18
REGLKINTYRGILQANSSGEKKISSGQVAVTQSTGRRDFFFEESTPPKYFGGKQLNINILPLPQNKPTNFQNIVGKPTLDYTWSSDNIDVGDSILLTVKISGDANLDSLEKIIPKEFRDFNVFESLKNKFETINNGNYYAEKTFEVALIPKQVGEIDTPEIKIPYFDTTIKAYKYLTIPSKKIKVNKNGNIIPSNSEKNFTSPTPINNQVENKIEDVVINSVGNEKVSQHENYNYLIIGLIAIIIIQGATIIYLLFRKNGNSSSENLGNLAKCKDDKEFYNAYCDFMKSRYNFSPKVHLEDRLVKLGFSPDFIEINRELEQAYYNNTPIDRKEILKRIKRELKNEK